MASEAFNATLPVTERVASVWADIVAQSEHVPISRIALLGAINLPVLAIVLNVLWQLLPFKDKSRPPVVFHWLPFIGSAISYGNDPVGFFFDCREKYGDVFTFILIGRKITVALGPKGNNFVLGGKSTVFNAEDAYTHLTTPVFGTDVVYDVPNEKFMQQKKFVKIGLSVENFKQYVGMIEDEVLQFLNSDSSFEVYQQNDINEWGSFDPLKVVSEITICTAARTLQGKEIRSSMDKTFAQLMNDLDGGFTPINFLFPNLPLENYRKRDVAQKKLSQFYINIIRKRKELGIEENDMMSALMKQSYRDGTPIQDHQVAHMLIALLMAGQHTSASTGSWTLSHLAREPEMVDALYQEQMKHFGTPDGKLRDYSYDELRELPVLDHVIRETLRMHPPIHSIMRAVRDDVPVPGSLAAPSKDSVYIVPKGHFVLATPAVSQMDPTVWKDAEKWDPSRWDDKEGVAAQAYEAYLDENGEKIDYGYGAVSKGTESPYQPFGAGRHRCIGEQFAYLQLGTIITTFIRHMELRSDKLPEPNYHTMIVLPKEPRMIQYRRRKFA